jgi:excisionase family DNA binding protein
LCDRLLLTVVEAAARLGLKRSKAYELIQRRELASIKIDGSRRVLLTDLDAFVRRLRDEQAGDIPDGRT